LLDRALRVGNSVDVALELHCSLLAGLEDGHIGDDDFPILGSKPICQQRRFFRRVSCSRTLASCFVPRTQLIVIGKLVIDELVDRLPQFNSTLRSVVPAVPPCKIVTYKLLRPSLDAIIVYRTLEGSFL